MLARPSILGSRGAFVVVLIVAAAVAAVVVAACCGFLDPWGVLDACLFMCVVIAVTSVDGAVLS